MKKIIFVLTLLCAMQTAFAQKELLGDWRTIDDKTNEERSVVHIFKATDGLYYGKILKITDPQLSSLSAERLVCVACEGSDKDKPVVGLVIIRGMRYEGGKLVGGKVLDPESGNFYYASISYDAATGRLKLRGSIDKRGILGRSQYWVR